MNQTYIPSCLRNLPKQKAKPRKQAIKDAKAEVIDQAIQLLREELRSGKLEGMMMPYQRGLKWHTEFGHLNRGDMLTSEQHRCSNEKKKF
ncbi:hypothetical protein [Shigella flexneri]|uniref:hypothetical protein n=1 Tax=Shigella flexneri TaxID=623 RepID=UPI0007D8BB16|nr:hypothetical protein [Shigella flexneri]